MLFMYLCLIYLSDQKLYEQKILLKILLVQKFVRLKFNYTNVDFIRPRFY